MTRDIYLDKLIRITLIAAIVAWSVQLLYPLLGIFAWGFILAVVLSPFYIRFNNLIGNKPALAASCITLSVLVLVIGVTVIITKDIAHSLTDITSWMNANSKTVPAPPAFIDHLPFGNSIKEFWISASQDIESLFNQYATTLFTTGKYAVTKLISTSLNFILFIIAIIFSGFLLVHHETLMVGVRKFAKRVANESGSDFITITRETIQNVCRGVIGISLLQTLFFWILLLVAQVPGAGLLSLVGLIISIAQVGLLILVAPIAIWLFFVKSFGVALTFTILLVIDGLLDSFLKPFVLAHGLSTPMVIIFMGVVCGILMYGLIGVFIGPVVLAITYELMRQWLS